MQLIDRVSNCCAGAWLPLYVASVVVSVIGHAMDSLGTVLIFKGLFVPLIAWRAYEKWPRPRTSDYYVLQLGYLCSWLGDLLLVFAKCGEGYFVGGAGLFLVQHCLYIYLNFAHRSKESVLWKTPYWGVPNVAYVILFCVLYYGHMALILKTECMVYAFFLGTSFISSLHRENRNTKKHILVVIGFLSFVASDILIAIENFLYPMTPIQSTSVLITYYIAQTLINIGYIPDVTTPNPHPS